MSKPYLLLCLLWFTAAKMSNRDGIKRAASSLWRALRRQFGRSSHVPGTFCGSASNHVSSILIKTNSAPLADR
jgi:hypothetical protein